MNLERQSGSVFFSPVSTQPITPPQESLPEAEASLHRKSAHAAMRELDDQLHEAGITTEQVWAWIKAENNVETRAHLTPLQYAKIACQLQAARRDAAGFKLFVESIPCEYFRIHVFADSTVCIGRPALELQHIASEWGGFQQIANDNQCVVTTQQGKRTHYYKPHSVPASPEAHTTEASPEGTQETTEAHPVKPVVSHDTNARGEVLSMWGTVMEVRTC